jgi:hypothetical protein
MLIDITGICTLDNGVAKTVEWLRSLGGVWMPRADKYYAGDEELT